jgi:hypothetical protein
MNSIINQDLSFLKNYMPSPDSTGDMTGYQQAQQIKLNAFRQESQNITLLTEEGDRVVISALSQIKADYMSFDYTGQLKGDKISMQMEELNASSKTAFQMVVEGDLNEEELEDIEEVLSKLDGIMIDLVSGDMDAVMNEALSVIDGADTITGLNATLQYEQRVSVEQRYMSQVTGEATGGYAPHLHPQGNDAPNGNMFAKIVAQITDQMSKIIEESSANPENLDKPINSMFKDFIDNLSIERGAQDPMTKLVKQLQENLSTVLDQQKQPVEDVPIDTETVN